MISLANRKPCVIAVFVLAAMVLCLLMVIENQTSFFSQQQSQIFEKIEEIKGSKRIQDPHQDDLGEQVVEKVDDSGAVSYLQEYQNKFGAKKGVKPLTANPNDPTSIKEWWQAAAMIDWYINSPIRYKCNNRVAFGNWHVCQDKPYDVKPPCLVYSFGINWDFSFDDAMGKLGCEVHSFDPSMNKESHKRSANVTFHKLGLGSFNTDGFMARNDVYVKGRKVWKMRTLKRVKEELGHKNKVLDVLKIDVEATEWTTVDNMMETEMFKHVRQFMLEFHLFRDFPLKENYVYLYNVYRRLRELGLREYAIGPHPKTLTIDRFNNQGDSEFINAKFVPS